jgi:tetratricopeptide (TPR) repeat protein
MAPRTRAQFLTQRRITTIRAEWVLLALVVLGGAVAAACSSAEPPAPQSATIAPPDGLGLQPVARPEVSEMGVSVQKQLDDALAALTAAIENRGTQPEKLAVAYGDVGNLLLALRELETAEPYYLNAQTLAPRDRRWPHLLGYLYQQRGPFDKAVAAFERALELQPDDAALLVRLGEVQLALGRHEVAAVLFDKAIARDPRSAAAWFGAGQVAIARNDDRAAVKALEAALERDGGATAIHYPLAMAYRRLGKLDQARAHLALQGDVVPRPADPVVAKVDEGIESALTLDYRGGQELAAGNYASAADYFERALKLSPDNASMRHRLGTALFRMGDMRGAEEQFERVVRSTQASRESHYNLALIMAGSGRMEAAMGRLSTALDREPGYMAARLLLARLSAVTGRPADALAHYTTALEKEPLSAEAALGYAMTLALLDRYAEARDRVTDGIKRFPDRLGFRWALARLFAAAPDDRMRNAPRALTMARELLGERQRSLDDGVAVGETYAMALAESGQYAGAAAVQRDVRATVQQADNVATIVRRLTENLGLYEQGRPCRRPWTADELPY